MPYRRTLLVTGSSGLIGSEIVDLLAPDFDRVFGLDNNMRAVFFGPQGDTRWRQKELAAKIPQLRHVELDMRDRKGVLDLVNRERPTHIVHAAAQPSHDLAARMPFEDFDTNAVGTLNLLEAVRQCAPEAVFVYFSTNKVYGDGPNRLPLVEHEWRFDYTEADAGGICESFPIDQSLHSLFGASKIAADVMVQEYGRYFNLRSCCLRGGCLTGPAHSGVELHGFLSYLIKCHVQGNTYRIFGYKGKQVRDNIHAYDVATFVRAFFEAPRCAEVYNLGGGRDNSISILEAFRRLKVLSGRDTKWEYVDQNRTGDHICYISDLSKMKSHYPSWTITKSLAMVFEEIYSGWSVRLRA